MGLDNTLFPPIVETNPAPFVYGNADNILKIKYPTGNYSGYKIGIKILSPYGDKIFIDSDSGTNDLLSVSNNTISLSLIKNKIGTDYIKNQYYKIQLRFRNGNIFSPWSSTILLKFISEPKVSVTTTLNTITGRFYFDEEEQEQFKNYKITIQQGTLKDTSQVFSLNSNLNGNFTYQIPIELTINQNYTAIIDFETSSGYIGSKNFTYSATQESEQEILTISAKSYPDLGGIMINLSSEGTTRNYTLLRATHKKNFGSWEVVGTIAVGSTVVSWLDITAESGVWYKYKAVSGPVNSVYYTGRSNPILLDLDSIFLSDKDTQFLVALNEDVNGFKYTVTESVTNTLGAKYPFVRRNANTKYRQFNLGGTISFLADESYNLQGYYSDSVTNNSDLYSGPTESEDGYRKILMSKEALFLTKQQAFQSVINNYNEYCKINGIDDFEDSLFEKAFRDQAMEFLTNGKPKLFRSATEGNILVVLTNVSFTPNKQLGRRIYSFTAVAIEIDECSIENYKKYNILQNDI